MEIIDIFKQILKTHKDNIGGEKLNEIIKIIKNKYNFEYIPNIGLIVNKQINPKIILVSHLDLIKKFNKHLLSKKQIYKIENNLLIGALDNTITNAVLLQILLENDKNDFNDIEIIFTEKEETGFIGILNYIHKFKYKLKNSFFINLDVTNEGYKENKSVSIEYDEPNDLYIKILKLLLDENICHFTNKRESDDIDMVMKEKLKGISVCLPTLNIIHSLKNTTKIKNLNIYKEIIYKIIINKKNN